MTVRESARMLWRASVAWGALAMALGALMLLWPGITVLVSAVLFGIYLLVSGVAQVASAFGLEVTAGGRILLFISGALSVVLAVLAFRYFDQGYGVWLLGIWIGIGFVFQGVSEIALAAGDRRLPARGWQFLSGALAVLAGLVMLSWPIESTVSLAQVSGAFLFAIGLLQVVKAFQLRRGIRTTASELAGRG